MPKHSGRYNMVAILSTTFSDTISQTKMKIDYDIFTSMKVLVGVKFKTVTIASGISLAPNRQWAMNRSNDEPVHWRLYASQGPKGILEHCYQRLRTTIY